MNLTSRSGLTLVEIVIAIVVLAVGGLGLAATSAAVVRQMASNSQRSYASSLARNRDELTHGSVCNAAAGSDRGPGIFGTWRITANSSYVSLDQTLSRFDSRGAHADAFLSGAPCD